MRLCFLVLICLGGNGIVFSQLFTLPDYRQRVLAYNQDVKQSREAIAAALYALKSMRTGFFPRMDVTGNYSWRFERVEFMSGVDLKHDNYSAEASVVQNVYSGNAVRKQYETARIQQAIALLGEKHTINNVVYAADVNYWTVVANRSSYDVAQEFVSIVGELFDVVNKRFVEGAISKTDVLMVQSRLKEAELQLNMAYTNYITARQAFNILMGADVNAKTEIADSIEVELPLPPAYMPEVAFRSRADYLMAVQEVELARLQTQLVKAGYLPNLAVGLQEKWGTTLINVDGKKRFSTIAFATLNIPVFYWGERKHNVRISETQVETRELARSKLADQICLEVNRAWISLTESAQKIDIVNSSLEIARNNLILNTFSYNEGKLPIIDVLSAQVSWLQTYTNLVNVHYQYKVALAEYIRTLGGLF